LLQDACNVFLKLNAFPAIHPTSLPLLLVTLVVVTAAAAAAAVVVVVVVAV